MLVPAATFKEAGTQTEDDPSGILPGDYENDTMHPLSACSDGTIALAGSTGETQLGECPNAAASGGIDNGSHTLPE